MNNNHFPGELHFKNNSEMGMFDELDIGRDPFDESVLEQDYEEMIQSFNKLDLYGQNSFVKRASGIANQPAVLLFEEEKECEKLIILEEEKCEMEEHSTHEEIMNESGHDSSEKCYAMQNSEEIGNTPDFVGKILEQFTHLFEIQELVENGEFRQNGPGRRRENPYRMASEIRRITLGYLRMSISGILNNPT
jgi:hypothetical protein